MKKENHIFDAPCQEKKCIKCCNTVLINPKSSIRHGNLSKDEKEHGIWIKRENEKWIPKGYGLDAPELDDLFKNKLLCEKMRIDMRKA